MPAEQGSRFLFVWLAAFALAGVAYGTLMLRAELTWGGWQTVEMPSPSEVDTVVIGSSRIYDSMSRADPDFGLLGDDRVHAIYTVYGIDELQAMLLLEQAIEARIPTILLETTPFATQVRRLDMPTNTAFLDGLGWALGYHIQRVKRGLKVLPRRHAMIPNPPKPKDAIFEPDDPSGTAGRREERRLPKEPDWLVWALAEARRLGLQVILVQPPLPVARFDPSGTDPGADFIASTVASLAAFGAPVWSPGAAWSNDHFADGSHVNGRGARRFQAELRAWYASLE